MANVRLEGLALRSKAPPAQPEGEVRVPLDGALPIAAIAGANLGSLLAFLVAFLPGFDALPREARGDAFVTACFVGTAVGGGVGFGLAARRARGRALVFDADGVWGDGPGEKGDPLPWTGMRLRRGRRPLLVAEDGRTLPFERETLRRGPDALYLRALVEGLPTVPRRERRLSVPLLVLVALGGLATFLSVIPTMRIRPDEEPSVPPFSPLWYGRLALLALALLALFGGTVGALLGYGFGADARREVGEKGTPSRGGEDELGALFRETRFRPPPVELRPGVEYRYRGEAYWRAQAKEHRSTRLLLFGCGLVMLLMAFAAPWIAVRPLRPGAWMTMAGAGTALFALLAGVAILPDPSRRAGFRIRVVGDRAFVSADGLGETAFPWPPVRMRKAEGLLGWTDELRAGRTKLRIDRRLLIEESPA